MKSFKLTAFQKRIMVFLLILGLYCLLFFSNLYLLSQKTNSDFWQLFFFDKNRFYGRYGYPILDFVIVVPIIYFTVFSYYFRGLEDFLRFVMSGVLIIVFLGLIIMNFELRSDNYYRLQNIRNFETLNF
jgi:hypothetical protein